MSADFRSLLAAGEKAQEEGRLEDAERAFRRLLEREPHNGELLYALGVVCMQRGAVDEGVEHVRKGIHCGLGRAEVHLNLARGLHVLGRYHEAALAAQDAIQNEPGSVQGYMVLGTILQDAGDMRRALRAYVGALQGDPANLDVRLAVARAQMALAHHDKAIAQFKRCHEQAPQDPWLQLEYGWALSTQSGFEPEAHAVLEPLADHPECRHSARWAISTLELSQQRPERAQAWLEPVRQRLESNPRVRTLLAQNAFLSGDRDRAVEEIRAALAHSDEFVPAWFELARIAPATVSDAELERIGQLAQGARNVGAVEDQVLLEYARAWALEAREQWGPAFEALKIANDLQAEQLPYDPEAEEERQRRRYEAFDGKFRQEAWQEGVADMQPVFILGMPRSGTTWVEQLLARHPAITATGENRAFDRMYRLVGNAIYGGEPVEDPPALVAQVVQHYQDYNKRVHGVTGGCLVDTSKFGYAMMPLLAAAFPEARFIHVRRDPMDVGLECYRKYFRYSWPMTHRLEACAHAHARMEEEIAHWQPLVADRFLCMNYEDLMADHEATARRLLGFVGLEWEDQRPTELRDERPSPAHVGLWRRYARELEPLRRALEKEGFAVPDATLVKGDRQ